MSATIELVPVDQTEAVKAARAKLAPVLTHEQELEQQIHRYIANGGDPHVTQFAHQGSLDPVAMLEARANLPATRAEHARVQLERLRLDAEVRQAREAERDKLRAALKAKKREAVTALAKALVVARAKNDVLLAIEADEMNLTGDYVDVHAWTEFAASTPNGTTRLDAWLDSAKNYGLFDK
jgi:hypothetical protein